MPDRDRRGSVDHPDAAGAVRTPPIRLALAAVAFVVAGGPGWGAERPPAALYQRWLHANEDCRGGSGDSADTMAACEYRNAIDRKMAEAGWCYGDGGRGGPYMDWRRCER